jgi:TorA maturation chaperone TorD
MTLTANQKQVVLESLEKLCSIFWGPDLEKCRQLLSKEDRHLFAGLSELGAKDDSNPHLLLRNIIENFSDAESLFDHLEEIYVRCFVNAIGGVPAPLYHSCYPENRQGDAPPTLMGEIALSMKQRFASKGLSIAETIGEPPDHLAIEIEYLYFLLHNGWETQNSTYLVEAASFAGNFMRPWVTRFRDRLKRESNADFYTHAATLLMSLLDLISKNR